MINLFNDIKMFILKHGKIVFILSMLLIYAGLYLQAYNLSNKPADNIDGEQNITINKATIDQLRSITSN